MVLIIYLAYRKKGTKNIHKSIIFNPSYKRLNGVKSVDF